ncbi:3'-5' exonuclease [Escherichia sp. HC-CC]
MDEGGRLEEERRLAYVGVTRAMQKLTLTNDKHLRELQAFRRV